MKTATVRQLRNEYLDVLSWVESGEEVAISKRGVIIAHLVPVSPPAQPVDWSQSEGLKLNPS